MMDAPVDPSLHGKGSAAQPGHAGARPPRPSSTLRALRNHTFRNMWLASLLSGIAVSAHDTAATWMMNRLATSSLFISLITSLASLPFFLFTLPAGTLADAFYKGQLLRLGNLWLSACAGLLAWLGWAGKLNPVWLLAGVFALGIGFAFNAPVWTALTPELVSDEELTSATTLGGAQMNVAGIVGPALGGWLLGPLGAPFVFSLNAVGFLLVAAAIPSSKRREARGLKSLDLVGPLLEASRFAWRTVELRTVLLRNTLFSFFISVVPSITPVLVLRELHLNATSLGLVFASMGIGSVAGALLLIPRLRDRFTTNQLTRMAHTTLAGIYLLMGTVHHTVFCLWAVALAGTGWTLAASELWVAAQRAMHAEARGRLSAVAMMLAQGATALGGLIWGLGADRFGTRPTLMVAALAYGLMVGASQGFLQSPHGERNASGR